jgi:transposase
MQDIQLYEQLLGLQAPWKVEAVKLDVAAQQIEVRVVCQETVWGCPECGERMHIHEWEERRWRHLDSCQFQTILVARMCRRHLANILTYFEHHLTNGPIEGLNNRIQGLVKKAFGYRNRERFKRDILFHLGDLDLYPTQ